MQLLTNLLPSTIAGDVLMGCSAIDKSISADFLTPRERRQWQAFSSSSRRHEFLSTRKLIRDLATQLHVNSAHFEVRKNEQGQPYGQLHDQKYYLSIAHTKNHVLCCISSNIPLGVDIEPLERTAPDKLRSRMMDAVEQRQLADLKTIRIWTIKEALVKLQGSGMRTNLYEWKISPLEDHIYTATLRNNKARVASFQHQTNWVALAWYN